MEKLGAKYSGEVFSDNNFISQCLPTTTVFIPFHVLRGEGDNAPVGGQDDNNIREWFFVKRGARE